MEPYAQGASGMRLVQYFDKSRMEINNPTGDKNNPFYVTNGLLTVELITGKMQVGDDNTSTALPPKYLSPPTPTTQTRPPTPASASYWAKPTTR